MKTILISSWVEGDNVTLSKNLIGVPTIAGEFYPTNDEYQLVRYEQDNGVELSKGDTIYIDRDTSHRVVNLLKLSYSVFFIKVEMIANTENYLIEPSYV